MFETYDMLGFESEALNPGRFCNKFVKALRYQNVNAAKYFIETRNIIS